MKTLRNLILLSPVAVLLLAIAMGCNSSAGKMPTEQHAASIHSAGSGMIYVDKIDCQRVMQAGDGSAAAFHCYQVGFIDSLVMAKARDKKDEEAGKYFQYDMQNDWSAVVDGDTLLPVHFETKLRRQNHRNECIVVFEHEGKTPDTLLYNDSFGSWGTQLFIINRSKK
jgi:hypothetical protein